MPKVIHTTKAVLGERKAIQNLALEFYDDGTAQLGVTVWVPTVEAGKPIYKSVVVAVIVTSKQRAELIEALKGPTNG